MANNTINAAENAAMANNLVQTALAEKTPEKETAKLTAPYPTLVTLPGGFVTSTGEVITTAEVRELTGRDEEAIVKAPNVGRALATILSRGVVKVGDIPADEKLLDSLLAGDRDALLMGIYRVTFGDTVTLPGYEIGTGDVHEVEIDILKDIKMRVLTDPINDRKFTVKGRNHEYTVILPTGVVQKEMVASPDKSVAELISVMLYNCVVEIDGNPVVSIEQVRNLGLVDRRTLNEELTKRAPGPQFEDIKVANPDGDGEVVVPISLGTMFRL